jgi:uncharacterized protein (DUF2062 family)
MMSEGFVRRRLIRPLTELLTQGVTPQKIAGTLALGLVLGVFPLLGSTTMLCGMVAAILGLNLAVIQLANWIAYPLQLLALVPLIRLGELLFHAGRLPFTLEQMLAMSHNSLTHAIATLWLAALQAIVAWLLLSPLAFLAAYTIFLTGIQLIARRTWNREAANGPGLQP